MTPRTMRSKTAALAGLLLASATFAQPQSELEAPDFEALLTIDRSDARFSGEYCQVPLTQSFCKDIPVLPGFLEPCIRVREARASVRHHRSTGSSGIVVSGLLRASGSAVVDGKLLTFAAAGKVVALGEASASGTLSRVGETDATLRLTEAGNALEVDAFGETLRLRRCSLAASGGGASDSEPPARPAAPRAELIAGKSDPVRLGTFQGRSPAGDIVDLTLVQHGEEVRAVGTLGGQPAVLSGLVAWSAVGSLLHGSQPERPVSFEFSADRKSLRLEIAGERPIRLRRGGDREVRSAGEFSGSFEAGRFEAGHDDATLVELSVVQSGGLLTGGGRAFGQSVGLTGRTGDHGRAKITLVFLDQSRVRITLQLPGDDGYGRLEGLGAPLTLRRASD